MLYHPPTPWQVNTLKFANRAKSVKNQAVVNKDVSEQTMLAAYQSEIEQLKQMLKAQQLMPTGPLINEEELQAERCV